MLPCKRIGAPELLKKHHNFFLAPYPYPGCSFFGRFSFWCFWEQQKTCPGKDRQGGSLASSKERPSHSCTTRLLVTVRLDSSGCVVLKEISCSANPLGKICFLKCCVKWEGLIWYEIPPVRIIMRVSWKGEVTELLFLGLFHGFLRHFRRTKC